MKPVFATASLCLALFASAPRDAFAENPAESRQQIEAVIKAFGSGKRESFTARCSSCRRSRGRGSPELPR